MNPPSAETQTGSQALTPIPPPTSPHAGAAECIQEEEVVEIEEIEGDPKEGDQGSGEGDEEERAEEEGDDEETGDELEGEGNDGDAEGDNEVEGREAEDEVDDRNDAGEDRVDEGNEGDKSEAENYGEKETVEGEIPEEVQVVEREGEAIVEEDGGNVETEKDVDMDVGVTEGEPENFEGVQEIIVLEEESEMEEAPTDERATRRSSRMARRLAGSIEPEAQESPEIMEEGYAAERRRKGKQEAMPLDKRPRQASKSVVIQEPSEKPIQVPYVQPTNEEEEQAEEEEEQAEEEKEQDEVEENEEEEHVYELMEVLVDRKLLDAMVHFKDPKKSRDCESGVANGKVAKSGKRLHPLSLQELDAEE